MAIGNDAFGLLDEPASDDVFEPVSSTLTVTKDMIRLHMRSFTHAMLRHAVTMTFLQEVKADNNWDYLVALNEIETMTSYGKQKINEKVRWGQHFEVALSVYPNIATSEPDLVTEGDICQACGDELASKSLQVYSNESYDYESMACEKLPELDGDSTHPAIVRFAIIANYNFSCILLGICGLLSMLSIRITVSQATSHEIQYFQTL